MTPYKMFTILLLMTNVGLGDQNLNNSTQAQASLVSSCVSSFANRSVKENTVFNYCTCTSDKILKSYSLEQYSKLNSSEQDRVNLDAKRQCSHQFVPKVENRWSSSIVADLKSQCSNSVSSLKIEQKSAYCDCYVKNFTEKNQLKDLAQWSESELKTHVKPIVQDCFNQLKNNN